MHNAVIILFCFLFIFRFQLLLNQNICIVLLLCISLCCCCWCVCVCVRKRTCFEVRLAIVHNSLKLIILFTIMVLCHRFNFCFLLSFSLYIYHLKEFPLLRFNHFQTLPQAFCNTGAETATTGIPFIRITWPANHRWRCYCCCHWMAAYLDPVADLGTTIFPWDPCPATAAIEIVPTLV